MTIPKHPLAWRGVLAFVLALFTVVACAQQPRQEDPAGFSHAELDQMLAPIALYPDALLSQILMAATYPLEVVEAARWSAANPGLEGEAATEAVADQDWDPSVKALVALPELLARMDRELEWTRRLGDAYLLQEETVVERIQLLREAAYAAGHLDEMEHQRAYREGDTIIIEPASPRVVYVPYYHPRYVYSSWWWPAYPAYYWGPPPGFRASVVFHWGRGVSIAPTFFFSTFHWHQRHIVTVDRRHFRPHFQAGIHRTRFDRAHRWRHDPRHRRGVIYSHGKVKERFRAHPHFRPHHHGRSTREARRGPSPRQEPSRAGRRGVDPRGFRSGAGSREVDRSGFRSGVGSREVDRDGFPRHASPSGSERAGERGRQFNRTWSGSSDARRSGSPTRTRDAQRAHEAQRAHDAQKARDAQSPRATGSAAPSRQFSRPAPSQRQPRHQSSATERSAVPGREHRSRPLAQPGQSRVTSPQRSARPAPARPHGFTSGRERGPAVQPRREAGAQRSAREAWAPQRRALPSASARQGVPRHQGPDAGSGAPGARSSAGSRPATGPDRGGSRGGFGSRGGQRSGGGRDR